MPVLPNPALQWTAMAPEFKDSKWRSDIFMKSFTISSEGFEPSTKKRSV